MSKRKVGPYEIEQENIGHGGWAVVHLARHSTTNQLVALKEIYVKTPGKDIQGTLRREILAIQALTPHPYVISVYHVDFENDMPYYTMDYASGGDLSKRMPEGIPLSVDEANTYLQQIAIALQHAHERGIVHCDLKPENVLIAEDGHLLLADFGVSRSIQTLQARSTQRSGGTPIYMSPEQSEDHPLPASDQYALGVLAYELLAGYPPFRGKTEAALLRQHMLAAPPSLVSKNPAVSPQLEAVVFRALAKDPADRFPTVRDFAQAFHSAIPAKEKIEDLDSDVVDKGIGIYCIVCVEDDSPFAKKLCDDLLQHGGVSYALLYSNYSSTASNGVATFSFYDKILLILSQNMLASRAFELSVLSILDMEARQKRSIVLPISLDGSILLTSNNWAIERIRQSRFIYDFVNWNNEESYQQSLNHLLSDIDQTSTLGLHGVLREPSDPSYPH